MKAMRLEELIATFRPESWGRNEDWAAFAERLWREEGEYLAALQAAMRARGALWLGEPVPIHDGVVQDGHHRIVVSLRLRFLQMEVPLIQLPGKAAAAPSSSSDRLTSLTEP